MFTSLKLVLDNADVIEVLISNDFLQSLRSNEFICVESADGVYNTTSIISLL